MCINRLQTFKRLTFERNLFKALRKYGTPRNQVEEIKEEFDRKPSKNKTYWYYAGPNDKKTRPFCKKILEMDKVFEESEIERISGFLGYDVLREKGTFGPGAFNCRHNWVKFKGREIATPKVTVKELNDLIRKGIKV